MQSFDTKDSNTLESFDRKFESFDTFDTFSTKDSEVEQSDNDFVESSIESLKVSIRKRFGIGTVGQ